MKKIVLLIALGIFAFSFDVAAQTTSTTTTVAPVDTLVLKQYVGKYKLKDAPIEDLIVTLQDGKLMGEAVGQGSAQLAPTTQTDIYDVVGYDGKVEFIRNESKIVVKIKLSIQGNSMEGEKQQ
ncbi:DUF3471 domain-containing protein [Emticicia sp. SJ17W-69]|uniref:DUF3471 domain-containing protein n=1 Tax=Emticicia sp. SJ17W-69 TaxID=3421657 RepID=UPI003EC05D22